jgi:hypothetical protein
MFDKTATYHKSTSGSEAIATRSSALTPKLRSMLILIDGKRGFDELAKLGSIFGDPEQQMAQLAELGFIEPVAGTASSGKTAAPADGGGNAGVPAAAAPKVTLLQAQRHAVRRLSDLLGPVADELCMRIEKTRNPQEFQAALQRAEAMLRQIGGSAKAAQFAAEMESHRPG